VVNNIEPRIKHVEVTEYTITAYLVDGRVISVPIAWSWRLSDATPEQRNNWELIGDGQGVHCSDIDEDISAKGIALWGSCSSSSGYACIKFSSTHKDCGNQIAYIMIIKLRKTKNE
jgi:hypothetical protein